MAPSNNKRKGSSVNSEVISRSPQDKTRSSSRSKRSLLQQQSNNQAATSTKSPIFSKSFSPSEVEALENSNNTMTTSTAVKKPNKKSKSKLNFTTTTSTTPKANEAIADADLNTGSEKSFNIECTSSPQTNQQQTTNSDTGYIEEEEDENRSEIEGISLIYSTFALF